MDKIVPTSISSYRGKIPGTALLYFHKNNEPAFAPLPEKGVSISRIPTFSAKTTGNGQWVFVSVTHRFSVFDKALSGKWQGFSGGLPGENPGVAVEKPNFSTVSTDLSTALFHRQAVKKPGKQLT